MFLVAFFCSNKDKDCCKLPGASTGPQTSAECSSASICCHKQAAAQKAKFVSWPNFQRNIRNSSIFESLGFLNSDRETWRSCQLNLISKGPQVALASIPYLQDSPKHSNSSHKHNCFWENSQHPTFIFSDRKWRMIPLMLIFPLPYICTLLIFF